jgi:putative membrane protein
MMLHPGRPPEPHDLLRAWETAPAVTLPLLALAAAWGIGARRVWARAGRWHGVRRRDAALFAAGWLALAVALVSPLHALGGALFSAHMAQHELLAAVAAPLLVLARPEAALAWALPARWRQPAAALGTGALGDALRALTRPLAAWWLHAAALWLWHLPGPYQATLRSDLAHAAQHASFLGTALLLWWALLRGPRLSRGAAVAYLWGATVQTGALGALFAVTRHLLYPAYAASTGAWGLTPMEDQALGGMIMWMPGGLPYLLAGLWLMAGWLEERPAAAVQAGLRPAVLGREPTSRAERGEVENRVERSYAPRGVENRGPKGRPHPQSSEQV